MHATFVTLWLQVVQPLANVHETKWTPHVKLETDVAQSYTSSDYTYLTISVRQAAVAAQRTVTFQYGRPLERHS